MNISATPLSRNTIRKMTRVVRKHLNFEDVLYCPIVDVIETLAANDELDYEIVNEDEMLDTYGTTNTINNIMKIRENVYDGAVKGNPRDRFTLCHEFGHWLLHQPKYISFARGNIPIYRNPEWQANTFAAELMIPYNLVYGMNLDEIVNKCGVSYTCAKIQSKYIDVSSFVS